MFMLLQQHRLYFGVITIDYPSERHVSTLEFLAKCMFGNTRHWHCYVGGDV